MRVTDTDSSSGLDIEVDGRATMSNLARNIEVVGGYDPKYDFISGVGPDLTDYGATIRLQGSYKEAKKGWKEDMAG